MIRRRILIFVLALLFASNLGPPIVAGSALDAPAPAVAAYSLDAGAPVVDTLAPEVVVEAVASQSEEPTRIPVELLELVDMLIRLTTLAFLVMPATELRRLFGGLPSIPLPANREISAGRWVSWLVSAGMVAFGHWAGLLAPPDWINPQAWLVLEWGVLAGLANIIYTQWWKGTLGLNGSA